MTTAILISDDTPFFTKVLDKSIIAYCINNFLSAEQIQQVIVLLPVGDRKNVNGSGVVMPALAKDCLLEPSRVKFEFYAAGEDIPKKVCWVAAQYQAQNVVIARASSGLLPNWLINDVVYKGCSEGVVTTVSAVDEMFEISFLPFWHVARIASHSDERDLSRVLSGLPAASADLLVCRSSKDLIYKDPSQIEYLEIAYREHLLGTDVEDIIEALNVK